MNAEDLPTEGIETSGGTVPTPSAVEPPSETPDLSVAPEAESNPDPAPTEVEASVQGEADLDSSVTVGEDGEVESIAPESSIESEGGETEVLAGDVEPLVLNSGDELPAHRQSVES